MVPGVGRLRPPTNPMHGACTRRAPAPQLGVNAKEEREREGEKEREGDTPMQRAPQKTNPQKTRPSANSKLDSANFTSEHVGRCTQVSAIGNSAKSKIQLSEAEADGRPGRSKALCNMHSRLIAGLAGVQQCGPRKRLAWLPTLW